MQISSEKSQNTPSQSPLSKSQASKNKGKTSGTKGPQNNSGNRVSAGLKPKGIFGELYGKTSSVAFGDNKVVDKPMHNKEDTKMHKISLVRWIIPLKMKKLTTTFSKSALKGTYHQDRWTILKRESKREGKSLYR